jgi:lipopolysaccharide O-acetyltransferase
MCRFRTVHGLYALVLRYARHPFRQFYNRIQAHKFGVKGIRFGPGARLQGISAIQMGEGFSAGPGLWLEAVLRYEDQTFTPRIVIGRNVEISTWGHIAATHYVEIGDDVLIGSRVIITDHNHGQYSGPHSSPEVSPRLRPLDCDKEVVIGRNVWLGDGVVVAPGARIGEGSVIGANSVVIGTIPPFTLAAGAPARALKRYDFAAKEWVIVK